MLQVEKKTERVTETDLFALCEARASENIEIIHTTTFGLNHKFCATKIIAAHIYFV